MPTLLMLRHAQAQSFAARDHDRALTDDGVRAAQAVGRMVAKTGVPDQILVSTARRARQTLDVAMRAGGWAAATAALDALYGGGPDDVFEALHRHGGQSRTVLVVGHEPWCSATIELLTGARLRMATATLATLQVGPAWDALDPTWCVLESVVPLSRRGIDVDAER